MKAFTASLAATCALVTASCVQAQTTKTIDNGSSGPYKAAATKEAGLPGYTVYRPMDLESAVKDEGKLPVVVFGNGGCADTSITHERVLSEIASHGYVIVAIGELQLEAEREPVSTESSMLIDAMNWAEAEARGKGAYAARINADNIASMGQSCGGAQALYASPDPRVKTTVMFNSGMGDMAGASKESLKNLHHPIAYIVGGPSDVAFPNAELDYQRIDNVPVVFASLDDSGHMGTFGEEYGGSFARMAVRWLDWQLKGQEQNAELFLEGKSPEFPGWTIKAKNF